MGAIKSQRSDFVRAMINRRRGPFQSIAWALLLLLAPTVLRWLVDQGALGLPFISYWPSILIASLLLETRYAVALAILTAILSQRVFGGGAWFYEVTAERVIFFLMFAFSAGLIVATGAALRTTIRQVNEAMDQQEQFNRELRHRVRNMLTLIQALASRGPKAESPLDFFKEFSSRLEGLARASDLLQIGAQAEGRLPDLVTQTIQPFNTDGRIRVMGEPCLVPPDSCIPLIMALHELCTNAVKHGSLSVEQGRVDLRWFIAADGQSLYLLWKEIGGPAVNPPRREGIGTRLLMPQPGLDAVELTFDPDGVWCEFCIIGARPASANEGRAR